MRPGALATVVTCVVLAACGPVPDPTLHPAFDPALAEPPPLKPATEPVATGQLLWGDLHIHTSYSTDAYVLGVRAVPDDAYRFARGGTIEHAAGYPIRIGRPLDFAAVTDHSEYLGAARADGSSTLPLDTRSLRERLLNDGPLSITLALVQIMRGVKGLQRFSESEEAWAIGLDAWQTMIESAESHYEPGVFTTFVGYEWSSMPADQNLHRNVIYKNADVPEFPFSSLDSENPEDLWDALDAQRAVGMEMLAIPHNGNVSNGLMYDRVQYDGSPMTADYARQRNRNEPVGEILQIKGTSETHPLLSPQDEFADFELMTTLLSASGEDSEPRGSYARDALRTGLEMSHSEGFNPYRFGVIGSSDSHNASSSVEEDNHHGKLPLMDGTAAIRLGLTSVLPQSMQRSRRWGAAGLAAVWAEANTREAIFEALERRETYATSGPRIRLRFFGSFDFALTLMDDPALLAQAYAQGVPMGGMLTGNAIRPGTSGAPRFAVWAEKDPQGANLDRLQIIKGWVDSSGRSQERVFDIALSDEGRRQQDGRVTPVGNTVDVSSATYTNSIGAPALRVLWQDPDFDPAQQAFYYARAIEIHTPRWSTYDAQRLQVEAPSPTSLQERAISSAIFYEPAVRSSSPARQ